MVRLWLTLRPTTVCTSSTPCCCHHQTIHEATPLEVMPNPARMVTLTVNLAASLAFCRRVARARVRTRHDGLDRGDLTPGVPMLTVTDGRNLNEKTVQ